MTNSLGSYKKWFSVLTIMLLFSMLLNISLGSVSIPFTDTLKVLFGGTLKTTSWEYIILNYRVPKALTASLVGGGLEVSGLLMQTLLQLRHHRKLP